MAKTKAEKWKTLKHNGPMLPPPFKKLPAKSKLIYKDKKAVKIKLTPRSEEVAVHYARYLMRDVKPSPALKKNYFQDWTSVMTGKEKKIIKDLAKCDFSDITDHLQKEADKRNNLPKLEKERAKRKREKQADKFNKVLVDGKQEMVNNCMVEPPGLYLGRGKNMNIGRVKKRIQKKDITINCSQRFRGHFLKLGYKDIIHDPAVTWIASWKDTITHKPKYVFLHASSRIKAESEQNKYKKAKLLARKIKTIQNKYRKDLSSNDFKVRQLATALYLIEEFALRVGNEHKSSLEAKTVGCLSLEKGHIESLSQKGRVWNVRMKFLGKDSVPFDKELEILPKVGENLKEFLDSKKKSDKIFHAIKPVDLNQYLNGLMTGLTAKVFRTYKATSLFNKEMEKRKASVAKADLQLKILAIKEANMEVAKFLNHKKMLGSLKNIKAKETAIDKKIDKVIAELRRKNQKYDYASFPEKIQIKERERDLKKDLVQFAPETSKNNYIDPRDVYKWCKQLKVPVEKIYSKAQIKKFQWAFGKK